MKKVIFALTLFILYAHSLIHAQSSVSEIDIDDYLTDQSGLLSYSFEKRMESYLKTFYQSSEVKIHIVFLQSLAGKDVVEFNNELLEKYGQNKNVVIFTLSMADRLFNVARSENLSDRIPALKVESIVEILLPYIKAKRFEHSVTTLSDMVIFAIDSDYKLAPPPVSQKQFVGNTGLLFFLVLFIVVIMLGRKIFSTTILFSSHNKNSKRKFVSGSW